MAKSEVLVGEKSPNGDTREADSLGPRAIDFELNCEKQIDAGVDRECDSAYKDESQDLGDYIAAVEHLSVGLVFGEQSKNRGLSGGKCFL